MAEHDSPDDHVAVYLREVASFEPLNKEEEAELFRELAQSSVWNDQRENVARRLIESQLSSVVHLAEKHSSSGVPILDLIEHGNLGLLNAVRSFAQAPAGEFTVYASARIEEAIQKFIADQNSARL